VRSASGPGAFLVALVLAGTVQGGAGASPDFTRADLPLLVFGGSDAPVGTHIVPISGPRLLEREGGLGDVLRKLRERGFLTDYGSQFEARSRRSAIGFFETLALLFRDEQGAARGLNYLLRVHHRFFRPARDISPHGLGEAAWAIRGYFFNSPSYVYGWRIGDVVQIATLSPMHGHRLRPNPSLATLRFARQLEALATEPAQPPNPPPPAPGY
jgi:hypothetical protein